MKLKSHIFSLLAICMWSSLELSGKLLAEQMTPYSITAWRFLIGGMVLLPFAIKDVAKNEIKVNASSMLKLGLLGILNVVISMLLLQFAIQYGKASLTAVIVSMNPLFVSVFAHLILKERIDKHHVLSLVLGALGLIVIVLGEKDFLQSTFQNLPLGIVFAVLASITFALYTVLTKKAIASYGNLFTNSFTFLSGAVILTIINMFLKIDMSFELSLNNVLIILYLGVFISGIAYILYFKAMEELTAYKTSLYFFLKPALASILAYVFLKEMLSFVQIVGIIFVMLALSRGIWQKLYERN